MREIRSASCRYLLTFAAFASPASVQAQTYDAPPVGISSSTKLTQDHEGRETWTYVNPAAVFSKYRAVIIQPTKVYDGPDAQFEGIDPAERVRFADIITNELQSEIGRAFPPPSGGARDDTLRIQVTLVGAKKTVGGLATATRVTPLGFASSALKSAFGKTGTLTGSVLFAVEAYDARTGELLIGAVRRRTPDPLDVPATLSTTDTVKAVARDFAKAARERLETLTSAKP